MDMIPQTSNDGNETKKAPKTLLLVGNSPNLVDEHNAMSEWGRLLQTLEDGIRDFVDVSTSGLSFPQRMQAICNVYQMQSRITGDWEIDAKKLKKRLRKWFNGVGDMLPTAVHRMLVELDFNHYLTTNYDLALDRVLARDKRINFSKYSESKSSNPSDPLDLFLGVEGAANNKQQRNKATFETKVHHIHGNITDVSSLVMTPSSYFEEVRKLKEKEPEWLKLFCSKEVNIHICGFNLRSEELVFWYALEQRFQLIQKQKIKGSEQPRTFVYLFYKVESEADVEEKKALRAHLQTYSVETVLIPVRRNDYAEAWKVLISEMMLRKNGWRMYQRGENDEELSDELIDALQKTQRAGGREASRGSNMSTAFTVHYQFPNHCLFTLSPTKRASIKRFGRWLCYCKIDDRAHMYEFSNSRQLLFLCPEDKSKSKVPVLVNYKTGELFCLNDEQNKMTSIGKGSKVNDIEDFASRKNIPK